MSGLKLFVEVAESPSFEDIFDGTKESHIISGLLRLECINHAVRVCPTRDTLSKALDELVANYIPDETVPILHISCHGSGTGIGLSDGTFITWAELRSILLPVNKRLGGVLVLCMSSCYGFHSILAAAAFGPDEPFMAVIGSSTKPSWTDTAAAYLTFYHHLQFGDSLESAVEAMKVASGHDSFTMSTAREMRIVKIADLVRRVRSR